MGDGAPCYVIAEAGSNHNGALDQARRLIDVAVRAGADAVKFQVFRAGKLYPANAGVSGYLNDPTPIFDIIAKMEMPYAWLPTLADHCAQGGVHFLASAFDEESTDRIAPFVPAFKIASYEMTHLPLVRHTVGYGKPVILSTGTANLAEVGETVGACREAGGRELALLQCTAAYPAPLDAMHVSVLRTLRQEFGVPVGLSDHSQDPVVAPVVAVACGAAVIEKHFTLSHDLQGPDHKFALEPDALAVMVQRIREAEQVMGRSEKMVAPVEEELRAFARRSVFAMRDIPAGAVLAAADLAVLRNGAHTPGVSPDAMAGLVGRRVRIGLAANRPIQWRDLEDA